MLPLLRYLEYYMKLQKQNLKTIFKTLSVKESKEALAWITSLSPTELKSIENLARILAAQILMEVYLVGRSTNKKKAQKRK